MGKKKTEGPHNREEKYQQGEGDNKPERLLKFREEKVKEEIALQGEKGARGIRKTPQSNEQRNPGGTAKRESDKRGKKGEGKTRKGFSQGKDFTKTGELSPKLN